MDSATTSAPRLGRTQALIVVGALGGFGSGLLGVGGGILMVPLLVLGAGYLQRDAHAISLGAIVPISAAAILTYEFAPGSDSGIDFTRGAVLAVGAVAGAQVGARMLANASERPLKIAFGSLLIVSAITLALS